MDSQPNNKKQKTHEKVEIYLSCSQLKKEQDQLDIQVRSSLQEQGNWKVIGETEVCQDNSEPKFALPISVDLIFEAQQPIMFEIFNVHKKNTPKLLGTVHTKVGAIMGAVRQTSSYDLKINDAKVAGQLMTQGEKFGKGDEIVSWEWKGVNLINTDSRSGGKSDPFLRFLKIRKYGDVVKVHETEYIMDNLNPVWKPFKIPVRRLCNNTSSSFKVECWDWEKEGKYQFIGTCDITLDAIRNGTTHLELRNPETQAKTGTLEVNLQQNKGQPSKGDIFIDYLRGGTQLNAVVAIDFTTSNGFPQNPNSLHYMNPNGGLNEYQKAIKSVCEIVMNYDHDQLAPVYGFGGQPLSSQTVSHCFPCTGTEKESQVKGLQGIMDIYSKTLKTVQLSYPTFFGPLLNSALSIAQDHKGKDDDVYTVLLILTDGMIDDMKDSIDAVVKASELPLSIIIVGVGKADFSKMETLDGDNGLTDSKGKKASRDIVQFVPFNKFNGDMDQLAQQVLAEVPDQLVQYMQIVGKKPKPAQNVCVPLLS